ncbi:hypothetical protein EW146_g7673 [Bondarzewia mesenterica]|uniref:Muskelin N-terminal domain-containing protein n=1 Tax=Bondarzewia mesenterica TaxID=1095465 RepID=A0A4S4LK59_9AGAM|nr:hypothetical protein EW146_g7673 [Bondarzewia mesenterica]
MTSGINTPKPSLTGRLTYTIAGASESSHRYVPENVLVNAPDDQSSRWSGVHEGSNVKQWLLLKLESLSVVGLYSLSSSTCYEGEDITVYNWILTVNLHNLLFQFNKNHPCNVKEFKIYVGMTEDHMTEILHAGLKNDTVPETFPLRHVNSAGVCFPSRFVKIVPLSSVSLILHTTAAILTPPSLCSAHSHSFHVSIWFLSLAGISDEAFVKEVKHDTSAKRRFLAPFKSIIAKSGIQIEHPLVTQLYESFVSRGDWAEAEAILKRASSAGLFDVYLLSTQPHAVWRRLYGMNPDGDVPCRRGGHAMCMDDVNGMVYIFGGWDGHNCLDDFWVYVIDEDRWQALSRSASQDKNGPGPRSCHKMVFDLKTGAIYLLGRLSESGGMAEDTLNAPREPNASSVDTSADMPGSTTLNAELYRYHTRGANAGSWELLSNDTAASGGPPLIFDHQMVIDSEAQFLYVCGGRVSDGRSGSATYKYSGLYSYDIANNKWLLLQPRGSSGATQPALSRRLGHSMVLDPRGRTLYIFAGMEDERYLSDMYAYHIDTNVATELFSNFTDSGGPDAAFTQRAVIDPALREIYVPILRTGCTGTTSSQGDGPNLPEEADEDTMTDGGGVQQPRIRYAHQVVYDTRRKTLYLHGGNAGRLLETGEPDDGNSSDDGSSEQRLDDLWSMQLKRPHPEEIARRAIYEVRCQQFREMCSDTPPVKALKFLQTEVSEVVDHSSPGETSTFRHLLSHLLSQQQEQDAIRDDDGPLAFRSSKKRSRQERSTDDIHMTTSDEDAAMAMEDTVDVASEGKDDVELLSQERFEQRTEVFERLLAFFPPDAKEPTSDLIDMIDWCEESVHD